MAVSLTEARRKLAQKLRAYEEIITGVEETPGDDYVGVAAGSEARRRLISSDIASTPRSGASPRDNQTRYDGAYVYVPSTVEQRRVTANGYSSNNAADDATVTDAGVADEKVGYLVPERSFGAVVPANTTAEIHSRLPVTDTDGLTGLHTHINRALRRMRIVKRVSIAGLTDTYRYDLTSFASWLTHPTQLGQVYLPAASDGLTRDPDPMPGASRLRFDGATPYLLTEYPLTTGDTFTVDFYMRAVNWILVEDQDDWDFSTVGLVNEGDQADLALDDLVLVAHAFACKALARRDPRGEEASWVLEAEDSARAAYPLLKWGEEQIPQAPRHTGWGQDNPRWLRGREGLTTWSGGGWR